MSNEEKRAAGTPIAQLITDRTGADVMRAKELSEKWVGGTFTGTAEELAEWLGGMKGAYNASDLNRVGAAVRYVADRMIALGHTVNVNPKTDWTEKDVPKSSDMIAYIQTVATVRSVLRVANAPDLPQDGEGLNCDEANAIEKVLMLTDQTVDRVVKSLARSASFMFASGNRPIPTEKSDLGRTWSELDAMHTTWENWQAATWYLLLYGNLEAKKVVE